MNQRLVPKEVVTVADKYRQRGYDVTFDPPQNMLPKAVQHCHLDFIASRGDEHIAVEVKDHHTLHQDPELVRLAEAFRQAPGWRLDLAVVGQDERAALRAKLDAEEIKRRLAAAEKISAETEDYAAALLLVWTTLEAALQLRLERQGEDRPVAPIRLGKLAYSLGIVDDEDITLIEWLVDVRNDVVHGRTPDDVSPAAYERARNLVRRIVRLPKTKNRTSP